MKKCDIALASRFRKLVQTKNGQRVSSLRSFFVKYANWKKGIK